MYWIDCKEKEPPKNGKAFLACVPGYQIDICSWVESESAFIDYHYKQEADVLFWMPLPAVPGQ